MAIPLIQNVEKQDINTSIIAIRRQLEQLYNALGVTESTVSSDDISTSKGTPLGTWASFENDYAPNIEWLQGGTTFNPNTYPALAMYLGGNTVPERYDHNRPSAIENLNGDSGFTLTTTNSVAPYDGIINFGYSQAHGRKLYVNNVARSISGNSGGGNTTSYEIKKGDLVRVDNSLNLNDTINNVIWFKHPLFIKATPTSADSDYEGTLNAIREFYVRNNTYSTEERLTGGYWIDGKPIYRKVIQGTFANTGGTTVNIGANLDVIHIGGFIQYGNARIEITASGGSSPCIFYRYLKNTGALERSVQGTFDSSSPVYIIVEYTKAD